MMECLNGLKLNSITHDDEYFDLGFLDFPGNEKIFPIDGQHRVEGIKAALKDRSQFKRE